MDLQTYLLDSQDDYEMHNRDWMDSDFLDEFWTDRSAPKKSLEQYNEIERRAIREKCFKMGKEDPWTYKTRKRNEDFSKAVRKENKEVRQANDELPPVKKASQEFKIALQQARMACGMKQKDVASKMKVTANVVADWESGKSVPSKAQCSALNKILRTTLPKQ